MGQHQKKLQNRQINNHNPMKDMRTSLHCVLNNEKMVKFIKKILPPQNKSNSKIKHQTLKTKKQNINQNLTNGPLQT